MVDATESKQRRGGFKAAVLRRFQGFKEGFKGSDLLKLVSGSMVSRGQILRYPHKKAINNK